MPPRQDMVVMETTDIPSQYVRDKKSSHAAQNIAKDTVHANHTSSGKSLLSSKHNQEYIKGNLSVHNCTRNIVNDVQKMK